ncbi:MAG: NAD(P)H-hydrate epimerase [Candidatus Omnitrophica bacterium]|nr:NAD(P)H-hydrate epimerase [Candidatus Omnitrophota bacterium]
MKYVTASQMRAIDRRATVKYGIPSILLMENAGRAVAEEVRKLKPRRVMLYCGSGNNGGDGFVAARHLANQGIRCLVVYFQAASAMKRDARLNFNILKKMRIPLLLWKRSMEAIRQKQLYSADALVDALFGTGLSREIGEPYASAIAEINGARKPVVSVDIPSGMDADTGKPMGACVRAARTVTLALPKRAFSRPSSRAWTGRVVVADISV